MIVPIHKEGVLVADSFKETNRGAVYLLPPSVQDWVPQNDLAYFVVEILSRLDLSQFEAQYRGTGGKSAYPPDAMLGLLFYGYATGIHSSRKLERAARDSLSMRVVTGNLHPDHDTIATFRKRFLPEISEVFTQILLLAQASGAAKLGKVSLDGTKVKANASKHKAVSWEYAGEA